LKPNVKENEMSKNTVLVDCTKRILELEVKVDKLYNYYCAVDAKESDVCDEEYEDAEGECNEQP
jgi:hypothetical protein